MPDATDPPRDAHSDPAVRSAREALLAARARGRCALIPYLTMGYPTLPASLALMAALEELRVDAIELGVPFSDPVADGPTIQRTIDAALRQGVTLRAVLASLHGRAPGCPRILFSYLNPLLAHGLLGLPPALRAAGVSAALVTDLVPEEAGEWLAIARAARIETCFLIAATSDRARVEAAAAASTGFVYCVSTLGVTGARGRLDPAAQQTVQRLRAVSDVPVAVGFGIARPEDVAGVARFADGAVVGSALLDAIGTASEPEDVVARAIAFLRPLLAAAHA